MGGGATPTCRPFHSVACLPACFSCLPGEQVMDKASLPMLTLFSMLPVVVLVRPQGALGVQRGVPCWPAGLDVWGRGTAPLP